MAVVKPGKLYAVQAQIGQQYTNAFCLLAGRVLEAYSNIGPRGMIIQDRIRPTPLLDLFLFIPSKTINIFFEEKIIMKTIFAMNFQAACFFSIIFN